MAEFDGIREREAGKNRMPIGMTVLFMGLILFGLVYLYLYTPQTTGWNQTQRYEEELKEHAVAREQYGKGHEAAEPAEQETAEAKLIGPAVYKEHCAVCHGENLEGGIGPGLLGPKFLYGNTLEDHERVITKGTPNGMPGFSQLGAEKMRAVAQHVHSRHAH